MRLTYFSSVFKLHCRSCLSFLSPSITSFFFSNIELCTSNHAFTFLHTHLLSHNLPFFRGCSRATLTSICTSIFEQ